MTARALLDDRNGFSDLALRLEKAEQHDCICKVAQIDGRGHDRSDGAVLR